MIWVGWCSRLALKKWHFLHIHCARAPPMLAPSPPVSWPPLTCSPLVLLPGSPTTRAVIGWVRILSMLCVPILSRFVPVLSILSMLCTVPIYRCYHVPILSTISMLCAYFIDVIDVFRFRLGRFSRARCLDHRPPTLCTRP